MPQNAWPLSDVVVEFAQPPCVAVVGRMKAGRSTLSNVLPETAISLAAGDECAEVVYVFQPGAYPHGRGEPARRGKSRSGGARRHAGQGMPAGEGMGA